MIVGPVFQFELVRLARRRQFFALRFGFGIILLAILGVNYLERFAWLRFVFGFWNQESNRDTLTLGELAKFGQAIFGSLMGAEIVLVIGLTPGLVADAISAERHRKTLHYLMASPLTSLEIVLGKLMARLSYVAIFLAIILPVASLLTLFGGVDPGRLFFCYLALGSTAYMLAALAILGSVLARRPRDSLGAAYALGLGWLFMPAIVALVLELLPSGWFEVKQVIHTGAEWLIPPNPLDLAVNFESLFNGRDVEFLRRVFWMVGSQCFWGTLVIGLAVGLLRPVFRRHEGHAIRTRRSSRRYLRVPPCGDDPVFWREVCFARSGGGVGRVVLRVLLALVLLAALGGTAYGSQWAFKELWEHGYGFGNFGQYMNRMGLSVGIRYGGAILFGIWMLALAGSTAATITSEREQDTWLSLLATPLDASDILKGKMLAAIRSTYPFAATLGLMWLIGLAAGAVHPIGLIIAAASAVLFIWFVAALGTYASLKAKSTWRARAIAQGVIVAPHFCCFFPLVPSFVVLLGFSLLSYEEVSGFVFGDWHFSQLEWPFFLGVAYFVGGYSVYAVAALSLTRAAFRGFDRVADRPRRGGPGLVKLKPVRKLGSVDEV